jgi:DNA-damage-inducible protein D
MLMANEIKELFRRFEEAAAEYDGVKCWSTRELQKLLGYSLWQNFEKVLVKAKNACEKVDGKAEGHFIDVNKMVEIGSGTKKQIKDVLLTRYACYLIAQNGDSQKSPIDFAQTYFAVQTRRSELIKQRLLETERVETRAKLRETEKLLSGVLYERGVDDKGFALIRSKGDRALFRLDTVQLKRKFGVPDNRPVANFLPTVSIKAKDFAVAMTAENVQIKDISGVPAIEKEHERTTSAYVKL